MSAECKRVFSFAKHLVTDSCNCLKAAAKKDSNAHGNINQEAGEEKGDQEGQSDEGDEGYGVTRAMRTMRMMRTMRARGKMRAIRKTVLNIIWLEPVRSFKWAIS